MAGVYLPRPASTGVAGSPMAMFAGSALAGSATVAGSALTGSASCLGPRAHQLAGGDAVSEAGIAGLSARLMQIEKLLADTSDVNRRHEQWWKSTQVALEQLEMRISQEHQARESVKADLHLRVAKETGDRDAAHSEFKEKMNYLEILVGKSSDNHSKSLEYVKDSHSRLTSDGKTRDGTVNALIKRVEDTEKAIQEIVERHEAETQAARAHMEHAHDRIGEEQKARDLHHETFCSHHASVAERFAKVEQAMSDHADNHRKLVSAADAEGQRRHQNLNEEMEKERRSREAHHRSIREQMVNDANVRDALHTTCSDRVAFLEKLVGDSAANRSQKRVSLASEYEAPELPLLERLRRMDRKDSEQWAAGSSRVDQLFKQMAACEARLAGHDGALVDLARTARAHADALAARGSAEQQADREAFTTATAALSEKLAQLDRAHAGTAEAAQASALECESLRRALEQLGAAVGEETARTVPPSFSGEPPSGPLVRRVRSLEASLSEAMRAQENLQQQLQQQLSKVNLRHDSMEEHLATEVRTRGALEKAVQHHLGREKHARDELQEAFTAIAASERASRTREQEVLRDSMQELLNKERVRREADMMEHREMLQSGQRGVQELSELISQDRTTWEKNHANVHDLLQKEQVARRSVEDRIAQERGDRFKHFERIHERVETLHRAFGGSPSRRSAVAGYGSAADLASDAAAGQEQVASPYASVLKTSTPPMGGSVLGTRVPAVSSWGALPDGGSPTRVERFADRIDRADR